MDNENYKKYIENRTVADIMDDWGNQRDEWEDLLIVRDGNIVKFHHSNGKAFFCEQYIPESDDFKVDSRLKEVLSDKTIKRQMNYFYVTESQSVYKAACGEITKEYLQENTTKLCDCKRIKKLLIKDGILIGAKVDGYCGECNLLLNNPVCTYYASDNEGSGTNDREDYMYLIFAED